MRILLIGEFSGVHNNLKKGLESLGHEVILAATGDGFKNFPYDINIAPFYSKYLGKILNLLYYIFNLRRYAGYDVVQYINPFVFPYYYHWFKLPNLLFYLNKKHFYYACGSDPAFLRVSSKLKYSPFDNPLSKEYPDFDKRGKLNIYKRFLNKIDKIIPAMYEYHLGYANSPKLTQPIPLPGIGDIKESISRPNKKIKILFGITRYDFKGANYILKALNEIEQKYKEKVDVSIVEKIPFSEYTAILSKADILIDQCKSYSYGMNAIIAMERGIIVFSGSESEAMKYLGIQNSSVINIIPNTKQIVEELTKLVNSKDGNLRVLKKTLQNQSKEYHNPVLIAEKFTNIYKE